MSFGVIEKVRKVFPGGEGGSGAREPVVALDDASFRFAEGELVALLGPSGCGKTTLLRIVGGLIQKTSGSVCIGGREIVRPTGDYGFVFQAPSLMPWRSVLDNVLFTMEILRRNDRAAHERARNLLHLVGLSEFLCASASVVGRNATTRRIVPGAHSSAEAVADGRAVRRAR
jgi:NitT/TauT family transport system ATP-binding protein